MSHSNTHLIADDARTSLDVFPGAVLRHDTVNPPIPPAPGEAPPSTPESRSLSARADALFDEARASLTYLDATLDALLHELERTDLTRPTTERLATATAEVCLFADTAVARYARVLARAPGLAKQLEYASPTGLLQHELGLKSRRAQDAVIVGKLLHDRRLPTVAAAIEDGIVSLCQGAQIVRVIDEVSAGYDPDLVLKAEASITEFATGQEDMLPVKPEQLRTILKSWFAQHAPEKAEDEHEAQWRKRSCTVAVREDGMLHLKALLPPEVGAAALEYLDAHASPRVRFTDLNVPNSTPASDGTGELIDTRTRSQEMADGLARAFQTAAAAGNAPSGWRGTGADRVDIR